MIHLPRLPKGHPERNFDCEMALEEDFRALADRAEAAGWSGGEVATALLSLAENILFRDTTVGDKRGTSGVAEDVGRSSGRLPEAIPVTSVPLA